MNEPLILVTNDDGITAPGIAALVEGLTPLGRVVVYAPDRQMSAVSHGVSLERPLRVGEFRPDWYQVDGTPTDCVMLAVRDLLGARPALVASGVNIGANLGDDVTYSGTVAGAYEGMLLGIPAIAFSNVSYEPGHFETCGRVAREVAERVLAHGLPPDTMLNVNVPDLPYEELAGTSVTRMGRRHYEDEIVKRADPRGKTYYWIGGAAPAHHHEAGTDFDAIRQNRVSVTPLRRDMTDHGMISKLAAWGLEPLPGASGRE